MSLDARKLSLRRSLVRGREYKLEPLPPSFTQPRFPPELVLLVLYYSDPRDIIRWRTVSKEFCATTQETALWKTMYQDVPFPRPPGPFPTQSRSSIERTLCKSAQLAESWTTRPMRARSTITVENPWHYATPKVICGRWLVVCEFQRRFILHDADPVTKTHAHRVLSEQEVDVTNWNVASIISAEGDCVLYVILRFFRRSPEWKMLEFRLNFDTGELRDSAVIDPPQPDSQLSRIFLLAGNSKFLFIPSEPVQFVFDTWTRVFYTIPHFYELPWESNLMLFSDSHFISLSHLEGGWTDINIFMFPPEDTGGERVLCHTHHGIIQEEIVGLKFLKPTVDPMTGVTSIRVLDCHTFREDHRIMYMDLTIPRSSPGEVLQLNPKIDFCLLPREVLWLSRYEKRFQFIEVSEDGHIRGFLRGQKRSDWEDADTDTDPHVMKFGVDTTQEPWIVTCSRIAPAEWCDGKEPKHDGPDFVFDGMRGRLFYIHPVMKDKLVVADIE